MPPSSRLPLSFSPSVVGPASNAALPLRLLPPLSSSTLVIEDPGFFACVPAPSHGAFFFLSSLYCVVVARHQMAPPQGACGRGCAPVPNSIWGRGLSERSEFRSPNLSGPRQRHPTGHARAPMVLGPFAETKGPRRAGPKPRKYSHPQAFGVTVKRRVPMRVTSLASNPTKMSTR